MCVCVCVCVCVYVCVRARAPAAQHEWTSCQLGSFPYCSLGAAPFS